MTTTTQQDEFIQQHAEDGALTPEQAAQLLEMGMQGDTGAPALDTGGTPDASLAQAKQLESVQQTDAADASKSVHTPANGDGVDPANAVVLAKDGVHTIEYQKLVDARNGEKHWKAQAEASQVELQSLKDQAAQRAAAGQAPTQTDNQVAAAQAAIAEGVDPDLFGDFSEEALAKGIQSLVAQRVDAAVAKFEAKLDAAVTPLQQQQATSAAESHYQAIYQAHPDADSLAESTELAAWIAKQPSFARAGYESVLGKGTTADVIELFDRFKADNGMARAGAGGAPAGDVKAAAKAAIAKAHSGVPASLTDIPGGRVGGTDMADAMDDMSGAEMLEAMVNKHMTPKQIDDYLNRGI